MICCHVGYGHACNPHESDHTLRKRRHIRIHYIRTAPVDRRSRSRLQSPPEQSFVVCQGASRRLIINFMRHECVPILRHDNNRLCKALEAAQPLKDSLNFIFRSDIWGISRDGQLPLQAASWTREPARRHPGGGAADTRHTEPGQKHYDSLRADGRDKAAM